MSVLGRSRIGPLGSVFVVMPYTLPHSGDMAKLIRDICSANEFEGRLADEPIDPGIELRADIFEYLRQAEIVLIDLASHNANVRYELGIARALGKRMLLLLPEQQKADVALGDIPTIGYGDLNADIERKRFKSKLEDYLHVVQQEIMPEVLDSVELRTRRIVADLKELATLNSKQLNRQTIWWSGFLSSFAVSSGDAFEVSEMAAKNDLLDEKDALIDLARRGCRIVCIISPPAPKTLPLHKSWIAVSRMKSLLSFLRSEDAALDRIDWLISPSELKNFCIIGNICCYERFQRAEDRGDAITLRQSSAASVRTNLAVYELLFEELAYMTLEGKPPSDPRHRRNMLRRSAIKLLEDAIRQFNHMKVENLAPT